MKQYVCTICDLKIRTADEKRKDAIHTAYDPYHKPKWVLK